MLQGALDGGLDIPHGVKRFVGYNTEKKILETEELQKYILGGHVSSGCSASGLLVTTSIVKSIAETMIYNAAFAVPNLVRLLLQLRKCCSFRYGADYSSATTCICLAVLLLQA